MARALIFQFDYECTRLIVKRRAVPNTSSQTIIEQHFSLTMYKPKYQYRVVISRMPCISVTVMLHLNATFCL